MEILIGIGIFAAIVFIYFGNDKKYYLRHHELLEEIGRVQDVVYRIETKIDHPDVGDNNPHR